MSRSDFSTGRRAFLAMGAALLGSCLLAGCTDDPGFGDTGALITGRTRLAPLAAMPPAGRVTVQILPFTGLPVTIADGIYQRFRTLAREADIDLVHRLEEPAHYRVQGHFVALGNESSVTVVFTYEIFDASGRRLHRIVGQEVAKRSDADPWSGVDSDAEARLAVRAARAIKAWLTRAAT